MEQEKRILIRKQFEMSSNKDKKNVILYLLDMGYDNKDLTEIFGVNAKKIYNIKAAKLNQHYMEQIIGTKIYGLVAELVREDENQIADLAMKGYSIDDIVIRIGYSKGTVGNIAQRVIVERKLKVPTKKEIKQGKKGKEKGTEKNISTTQNKKCTKRFSMEQANSEEIERLKRNYAQNKIESNREAIKRIITKLGDEKITDSTKKKILEYCKEIVKYDGTLTEDEYRILTDVITRDEAIPDMSGIRFVLDVCTQQHNFLPAMKLLNNCIEIYGSLPQLEEARDVISKTHRKQLMINSLEKDGNVEKTMREFGAQEAEVREIKRVYIDTNKEQSGNTQRYKRMNKKDDGIEM